MISPDRISAREAVICAERLLTAIRDLVKHHNHNYLANLVEIARQEALDLARPDENTARAD